MKGERYSIDYFVKKAENNDSDAQQFLTKLYSEYGHDTPAFKEYRQNKKQTPTIRTKEHPVASSTESTALLNQSNDTYYNNADSEGSYPYYQKAAAMGNILAKAQIAKMLYLGAGVTKDRAKAQKWFVQVLPQLESAAEAGDAFAQYLYGYYLDAGFTGNESTEQALIWYRRSAEQGNSAAQNNIGHAYFSGLGVTEDPAKACNWYKLAAEQSNVVAQHNLGRQYESGTGVDKDYAQAADWFKQAAKQGYAPAQADLGALFYDGRGLRQSYKWAYKWFLKAANKNNGYAQKMLGIMLEEGHGIEQDVDKAETWYKKAIANGEESAKKKLSSLQKVRNKVIHFKFRPCKLNCVTAH